MKIMSKIFFTFYNLKYILIDSKTITKMAQRFCVLFTQFPPLVRSYITTVEYQNQETDMV